MIEELPRIKERDVPLGLKRALRQQRATYGARRSARKVEQALKSVVTQNHDGQARVVPLNHADRAPVRRARTRGQ